MEKNWGDTPSATLSLSKPNERYLEIARGPHGLPEESIL